MTALGLTFDIVLAKPITVYVKAKDAMDRGPRRGPSYFAVFAVLYGLGLRVGEVSRLTLGELDLDRRVLWIRNSNPSQVLP